MISSTNQKQSNMVSDEWWIWSRIWSLMPHWQCWGSKPRFFLWRKRWISRKEGRSFSSRCQHSCMRSRTSRGHPWGVDRKMVGLPSRHIFERLDSILASLWLSWGCSRAKVRISQRVTPNDQTSVLVVNFPWKRKNFFLWSIYGQSSILIQL